MFPALLFAGVSGEDLVGIVAIICFFGWPLALITRGYLREVRQTRERHAARRMYERVMHHKLDVVETALAMGFSPNETAELDRRLAQLIGAERMRALLDQRTAGLPTTGELPSDDNLKREILGLRREREAAVR